jgi:hypothetical protein
LHCLLLLLLLLLLVVLEQLALLAYGNQLQSVHKRLAVSV